MTDVSERPHAHGLSGSPLRLTFVQNAAEDEAVSSRPARTYLQGECTAPMAGKYADVIIERNAHTRPAGGLEPWEAINEL